MTNADVRELQQRARRLRAKGLTAEETTAALLTRELQTFSLCFGLPLTRKAARQLMREGMRDCPMPCVRR